MNNITLTFIDPKLEQLYSQQVNGNQALLLAISLTAIIICGMDVGIKLAYGLSNEMLFSLIMLIYFLIQIILCSKFNKLVPYGMCLSNLVITLMEFNLSNEYNAYNGFLLGSNQMLIHCMLIFMSSYLVGVVSIILLSSIRLSITQFKSPYLGPPQYLYTIIVTVVFLCVNYMIEKNKRKYFFSNLREQAKDFIFPKIIEQPYYILQQNVDTQQLEIIYKNTDIMLNTFLIESKLYKESLKDRIYKIIKYENKDQDKIRHKYKSFKLEVRFEMETIMITFYIFNLSQQYYVLSIDSMNNVLQKTKQRHVQIISHVKLKIHEVLFYLGKLNQKIIQEKSLLLAIRFRIIQLQLHIITMKPIENKNMSISGFLNNISKYFSQFGLIIKVQAQEDLVIKTLPNYMILFILEFTKVISEKTPLIICAKSEDNKLVLTFQELQAFPNSHLFKKCINILIEKTKFSQRQFVCIFYEDPMISFEKYLNNWH